MRKMRRQRGQLLAAIHGNIPEGDYLIIIYQHCTYYDTPVGCFTRWHRKEQG